jgi:hypothetical protein
MNHPSHVIGQVATLSNNPADNHDQQVGWEGREQTDMSSGPERSTEGTVH